MENNNNGMNNEMFIGVITEMMNEFKKSQTQLVTTNKEISNLVNLHSNKLVLHDNQIKDLYKMMNGNNVVIEDIRNDILVIKENDRIEPLQEKEIKKELAKRIFQFIDTTSLEYAKYNKSYFGNAYGYLRKNCRLGNPIGLTKKKDYDEVMNGIITWYPNEKEIREKADAMAINRNLAKAMGY